MKKEKTGLFSKMKKYDDEEVGEILEEIILDDTFYPITAYNFLHGFCDIFALALNDIFNYPIDWVIEDAYEEYGGTNPYDFLTHAFCKFENNYMDIRGRSDNKRIFLQEFEDFFDYPELDIPCFSAVKLQEKAIKAYGEEMYEKLFQLAKNYIFSHLDWYTF